MKLSVYDPESIILVGNCCFQLLLRGFRCPHTGCEAVDATLADDPCRPFWNHPALVGYDEDDAIKQRVDRPGRSAVVKLRPHRGLSRP